MVYTEKMNIDSDLHALVIEASVSLLEIIVDVLKPCPTPGRQHYLFNMKNVITILQVIK